MVAYEYLPIPIIILASLAQVYSSYVFFYKYLEWNWLISIMLCVSIGGAPVIGGITGYIGATNVLQWSAAFSVLTFSSYVLIPFIFYILIPTIMGTFNYSKK